MKTLTILWKRFRSESPAILKRVKSIVIKITAALIAGAGAGVLIIDQYGYKVEWKEYLVGVILLSSIVSSFLVGLNLSTSDSSVQKLSDPKTGLPVND